MSRGDFGGGGIRTPVAFTPSGFQDRPHQPLGHSSPCVTSRSRVRASGPRRYTGTAESPVRDAGSFVVLTGLVKFTTALRGSLKYDRELHSRSRGTPSERNRGQGRTGEIPARSDVCPRQSVFFHGRGKVVRPLGVIALRSRPFRLKVAAGFGFEAADEIPLPSDGARASRRSPSESGSGERDG